VIGGCPCAGSRRDGPAVRAVAGQRTTASWPSGRRCSREADQAARRLVTSFPRPDHGRRTLVTRVLGAARGPARPGWMINVVVPDSGCCAANDDGFRLGSSNYGTVPGELIRQWIAAKAEGDGCPS